MAAGLALSPTVWMAISFAALISFSVAIVGPGLLAALSLAIPPRKVLWDSVWGHYGHCQYFLHFH